MFPSQLNPAHSEVFQLEGREVEIPKCIIQFQKWEGASFKETFGGKPLVAIAGKPMFAELAILTHFLNSGWQGRWTETYGRGNKEPIYLSAWKDNTYSNQTNDPITDLRILEMIAAIHKAICNSYIGCWDVLCWKGGKLIMAEAIRNNRDVVGKAQKKWLAAALSIGLRPENFLIVQWDFHPRGTG
jgi:hypothetical protein